ncbi:MAG: NADH-quinone oxidoreductase subunit I [Anaerolineae bacterium]
MAGMMEPFGEAVVVDAERCLNERHRAAGCRLCSAACPVDALAFGDPHPAVDAAACVACGACVAVCPTDALAPAAPWAPWRPPGGDGEGNTAIAMACPVNAAPGEVPAPVEAAHRHDRCLASLGLDRLLALTAAGHRDVWLDDRPCEECPIGAARRTFAGHALAASSLLAALGAPGRVALVSDAPAGSYDPVAVVEVGAEPVSRRSLFRSLGLAGGRVMAEALARRVGAREGRPKPVAQRLPHFLPASRRRLFAQLRRLARFAEDQESPPERSVAAGGLPFAAVVVDVAACSACGLCARFCPTGALDFEISQGEYRLTFAAAPCLDCDICRVACPEEAVGCEDRLSWAELVTVRRRTVARGPVAPCEGCGEAAAMGAEATLCYTCRRTGGSSPYDDRGRLMADVLRRISAPGQPTNRDGGEDE